MPATNQDPGRCNCGEAPPETCDCLPCPIPRANLTLSNLAGVVGTLVWNGSTCGWVLVVGTDRYTLTCNALGTLLSWEGFDNSEGQAPDASTCDPFHLHFTFLTFGDLFVDFP